MSGLGAGFALIVMLCAPAPVELGDDARVAEVTALVDDLETDCSFYDPEWLRGFERKSDCDDVKAAMAAPIIGGGARFECVPIDPE